jgi:Flp pilus assembly pilin Flp
MRISFNSSSTLNLSSQHGAAMIEYALLVALIAVLSIGSVSMLGNRTDQAFTEAREELAAADIHRN